MMLMNVNEAKKGDPTRKGTALSQRWHHMMRFWREPKGVSVVIGAVLMGAMGRVMYPRVQVFQVPVWNAQVEREHAVTVYDDLMGLKTALSDVAVWRLPGAGRLPFGR